MEEPLSKDEVRALLDELTLVEWDEIGDDLMNKGYAEINPLWRQPRQRYYVLTEKGIRRSEQLQSNQERRAGK